MVSPRSPYADDFGGLRCVRSYRRNLQSPHRRTGFYHRSADDRPDDVGTRPVAHLLRDGGVRHLLSFGRNHHVSGHAQRSFCRIARAGHHSPRIGVWHFVALFHPNHDCFRRGLRIVQEFHGALCLGSLRVGAAHLPFSAALRRGIQRGGDPYRQCRLAGTDIGAEQFVLLRT